MNTADSVFKIIIVHEDAATGLMAFNLIKRLASQPKCLLETDIGSWDICKHIWRFDWLQNPELWDEAVAKAVEADMIIISVKDHSELPVCVRSWIESVLSRKQSGLAVLVALLDGRQKARIASLPPARHLRQLAERYGVDFFCNMDDQPQYVESEIESILSGFEDDSVFVEEAISNDSGRREWGINE